MLCANIFVSFYIFPHIRNSIIIFMLPKLLDGGILTNFPKKWESGADGIKGTVRPVKPLKIQVNEAIKRIESQLGRINGYIDQYTKRDRELTEKIIQAYEKHDEDRAKILANELAEIRKHKDLLVNSKMSLDKAALRLRTIYEFGNFTSAVSLAKGAVGEVRASLSNFIPEINLELNQVEKMLDDVMVEVGQGVGENLNLDVESMDAQKILEEAALVAESKIRLPDLPKSKSDSKS